MESASEMPNDILEIITSTDIYWAITRLRPCLSVSTYWTLIRPLRDGYFDYPHWTLEGPGDFQSSQAPTFNKWRRQALPSCSSRLEQSPASLPIMSRCQTLMCFQTILGACGQVNSQASPLDSSKSLSVQSPTSQFFLLFVSLWKHFLAIHAAYRTADHPPPHKPLPLKPPSLLWSPFEGSSGPFIRVSSFPASPSGPPELHIPLSHPLPPTTPNKSPLDLRRGVPCLPSPSC